MVQIDTRAVLRRPAARADAPLAVLLHGLGSDERDLFAFAQVVPAAFEVVSLRAPLPWGGGFAWYEVPAERRRDAPGSLAAEGAADAAVAAVLAWLEAEAAGRRVVLIGFSQGASMVVQALRAAPERFAAVVALAGFLVSERQPGDAVLAGHRLPLLVGRGDADAVIPLAESLRLEAWARAHAEAELHTYPGLGHGVSDAELADVAAFLQRHA